MKKILYILLLVASLIILFSGTFEFANAQSKPQTLIIYPEIAGQSVAFGVPLPQLIRYIYFFAVGICGAIALAAILLGAIKYIGAGGNPSKMSDAKDQIFSALLGVVILLSSYLILYTINPDLISLGINLPPPDTSGLVLGVDNYTCFCKCMVTIVPTTPIGGEPLPARDEKIDVRYDPTKINRHVYEQYARRLDWGPDVCRTGSSYLAWADCKTACKESKEIDNLGEGVGCSNTKKFISSSIWSCSIKPQ